MARVNEGDWVYYVGKEYDWLEGALGFIEDVERTCYLVMFTQNSSGEPIRTKKYVGISNAIPAETPEEAPMIEQSFKALIDLALQTKDFEWCRQLTEQYKRVAKARV